VKRIVLDTNVWISGFIIRRSKSSDLVTALIQGRHQGIISNYLLGEIERTLSTRRLTFRYQLRREEIISFLLTLQTRLEIVEPINVTLEIRDPKDLPILGTALAGQASHLVTGDCDLLADPKLLAWMREQGVEILPPAELILD